MRAHIIERDEFCQLCGGACYRREVSYTSRAWDETGQHRLEYTRVGPEWHVDHVIPCAEGGTDDPDNLRLLCGRCHKLVTREWRRARARTVIRDDARANAGEPRRYRRGDQVRTRRRYVD